MMFQYRARLSSDGREVTVWSVSYQGYAVDIPAHQFPDWFADFMAKYPKAQVEFVNRTLLPHRGRLTP